MNRHTNFELVCQYGDYTQMKYGNQFGYYAKEITLDKINRFCNEVNFDPYVRNTGYHLTTKQAPVNNDYVVTLRNNEKFLMVPVMLLDHCVYIDATTEDWINIDKDFFVALQRVWVDFLSKNVKGYRNHYEKTALLSQQDLALSF